MQKKTLLIIPAALALGFSLAACATDSDTDTGVTNDTVVPGSTMSPSVGGSMMPSGSPTS